MTQKMIVFSFFILCINASLSMEKNEQKNKENKLKELIKINEVIEDSSYPFNGIIVVKKETDDLLSCEHGINDKQNFDPIFCDHKFMCGSITKQMLACLVLRNVESGRLDLNVSLSEYGIASESSWSSDITCHQLLNHTSGVIGPKKKLKFTPGSDFAYSNYGYHLLGQLLESITEKNLETLFVEMFSKIGLNDSGYYDDTTERSSDKFNKMSCGYMRLYGTNYWLRKEDPYWAIWPLPYLYPAAGGVVTTASDLHAWNQALYSGSVIDNSSLLLLTTPSASLNKEHYFGDGLGYGYGVWISENDDLLEYAHSGYVWGYMALNCYYPEHKTSLIIMENVSEPMLANTIEARKYTFRSHIAIRNIIRSYLSRKNEITQ